MKTLISLLMPVLTVAAFIAAGKFFAAEDYYTSALFTLVSLCSASLWITAISTKSMAAR